MSNLFHFTLSRYIFLQREQSRLDHCDSQKKTPLLNSAFILPVWINVIYCVFSSSGELRRKPVAGHMANILILYQKNGLKRNSILFYLKFTSGKSKMWSIIVHLASAIFIKYIRWKSSRALWHATLMVKK